MPSFDKHKRNLAPLKVLYDRAGHELRFVGGCVRDWVLGLASKDIDLATTMPAEEGLKLLKRAGLTCIPTGLAHGTITVVINHTPYEITTLRKDVTTDGRRATIHYTNDWQEDAARRDFTFNALYRGFDDQLYDYFSGLDDLKAGRVRFIGEAQDRILEDYLRILRLFRFYARYGKHDLDLKTLETCRLHASKVANLSTERVTQELLLLLETPECLKSLRLMDQYDILAVIFTTYDVVRLARVMDLVRDLDARLVISHSKEGHQTHRHPSHFLSLRRLAALSDDHHSLRLSNAQLRYLNQVYDLGEKFPNGNMTCEEVNVSCYRTGIQEVVDHLLIHGLTPDLAMIQQLLERSIPEFPLKGQDIINLGVFPGPMVKTLHEECINWWCRADFIPDREDCLTHVKAMMG